MPQPSAKLWLPLLGSALLLTASCTKDDDNSPPTPVAGAYSAGVFIINEGSGGNGNGVSFFDRSNLSQIKRDIYQDANGNAIGDIPQSLTVVGDKAYLVVNNSNKIEIVAADTYKHVSQIEQLKLPRYFTALSSTKGYVTEAVTYSGRPGRVRVINLTTNTLGDTIAAGIQPEQLLQAGGKVFVSNWGDNTLTIIDPTRNTVETSLVVGGAPRTMVLDADNKLWVLCGGAVYNPDYTPNTAKSTNARLVRIAPASNAIELTIDLGDNMANYGTLQRSPDGRTLYYTGQGGVFSLPITATVAPTAPLVRRGSFYGLGVDPKDGLLYLTDALDYVSNGRVIRYGTTGAVRDSFAVGVNPGSVYFRQ